ncbi:MAG: hypothetical protein ACRDZ2_04410 [Ilumatobacteraceae bacterium]
MGEHWDDLVTAALLGTDRRDPPAPPPGPLADVVDDAVAVTPSARMLVNVGATTAARRGGVRPRPATPLLAGPDPDDRCLVPPAAARRWRTIVGEWPVLEDEWLATVERRTLRLPPDVLVGLLRRHQRDAVRSARVMRLGGPLASWLVEQRPELAPIGRRRPQTVDGDLGELPGLPVPPALLALLTAPPDDISSSVVAGVADGSFGAAHRAVLVNFVARMRPDACGPLAEALRTSDGAGTVGLIHMLADLAEQRHCMLLELK